ncbi:helix-turn-helix transcriptional regulator [Numidum massiliense]|uniref:helix-turn-helix transcriptional regulator n=1 Tax=Numidum massiliense TaxID=1522315 RepID=UPI0006D5687F|nr:transcriptional regulator [Numidum massiliense]
MAKVKSKKEEKKIVTLIRMINLIQQSPGIRPKELAERLDINERQVYRYKSDLEAANIPIKSDGYGKGYTYTSNFAMFPLDLTEKELVAFTVFPMAIQQLGDQVPKDWLLAYEKIAAAITKGKETTREAWHKLSEHILLGTTVQPPTEEDTSEEIHDESGTYGISEKTSNNLADLLIAIGEQRTIEIVYHTYSRNTINRRKVDPYFIIPRNNRLYVIGYCHLKDAVRTFRFNRFREMKLTEETFDRGNFDLHKYLANVWVIDKQDDNVRFVVWFSPKIARYVLEAEVSVKPKITIDEDDDSVLMEVTVSSGDEFLRWLLQFGPEAEIIEPPSYREKMRHYAQKWQQMYS